jgi:type II secretory pathway component PulC
MSELAEMHILWIIATIMNSIAVLGMLWLYKSFSRSMDIAMNLIHDMVGRLNRNYEDMDKSE